MPNIRRAEAYENEQLTRIAVKSEAYWGYDSKFMESFETLYRVTQEFIFENPTYVITENGVVIGFYALIETGKKACLEYLYVEPEYIGKGYGKLLWEHMVGYCKENGVSEIELVTSPQAKEFYIKMGADFIEDVDSIVIEKRRIPRLIYTV